MVVLPVDVASISINDGGAVLIGSELSAFVQAHRRGAPSVLAANATCANDGCANDGCSGNNAGCGNGGCS